MKVRIIFEKDMLFSIFPKNVPESFIILLKLLKPVYLKVSMFLASKITFCKKSKKLNALIVRI